MWTGRARRWLALGLSSICLTACADRDLTHTPKYVGVIGAEYRTKTQLWAHGIRRLNDYQQLDHIWIAPVQQTGPEIAFLREIPVGHVFRVRAVRKGFVLLENGIEFVLTTDGLDLPPGLEIVVPLFGYMPTSDGFLDQARFERVGTRAP